MTLEEMLTALELDDPKRFGRAVMEARLEAGEEPERATGRTTAMLLNAVHQSQWTRVAVLGKDPSHSRILVYKARRMAVKCGIDPENLLSGHGILSRRPELIEWYADHTVDKDTVLDRRNRLRR